MAMMKHHRREEVQTCTLQVTDTVFRKEEEKDTKKGTKIRVIKSVSEYIFHEVVFPPLFCCSLSLLTILYFVPQLHSVMFFSVHSSRELLSKSVEKRSRRREK
jgi:hypothetical protein